MTEDEQAIRGCSRWSLLALIQTEMGVTGTYSDMRMTGFNVCNFALDKCNCVCIRVCFSSPLDTLRQRHKGKSALSKKKADKDKKSTSIYRRLSGAT